MANRLTLSLIGLFALAITIAYGQSTQLTGQVIRADGTAIPGVEVVAVLESDPSVGPTTVTDSEGRFTFSNLPPGSYRVETTVPGFPRVQRRVQVSPGQSSSIRLVVAAGARAAPRPPPPPPPPRDAPPPIAARPSGAATVPVFFATDRERISGPVLQYGRGRNSSETLFLGRFDVSVPRDHRLGNVERPTIWTLWREDPEQHFVIVRRAQLSYGDFYDGIGDLVNRSQRKEALVFIHGFNVAFEDAVYRTAQLAYDLGFDGAPILYSWPSVASISPVGYTTDSGNNDWTVPHLRWFLEDVAARSGAEKIHVIAHSMGNKALVNALDRMSQSAVRRFSQIVLTAPDVDAAVFKQLAAAVSANGERTTLYASSNDKALQASKTLAAYPRAGDATSVVVIPGIDTVDVSALATDFLGHSYYGSNDSVISDLFLLISQGLSPANRPRLQPAGAPPNQFWRFMR